MCVCFSCIPTITKVDREQQADKVRIAELETEVTTLKNQVSTFETQITELLARVSSLETNNSTTTTDASDNTTSTDDSLKCCKIIFFKTIYTIIFDTEIGNVFNLSFLF